jgi:hypothetical protein
MSQFITRSSLSKFSFSGLVIYVLLLLPVISINFGNGYHYLSVTIKKSLDGITSGGLIRIKDVESVYPQEELFNFAIKNQIQNRTKLITVGCNNLYSFKYALIPPVNTPLYWHNGVTFSSKSLFTQSYYEPNVVLNDVNMIALSYSCPHGQSAFLFEQHYSNFLKSNFNLIESTPDYSIWKKVE